MNIDYDHDLVIKRSSKSGKLTIRLKSDKIVVTVPKFASDNMVYDFLDQHKPWIEKNYVPPQKIEIGQKITLFDNKWIHIIESQSSQASRSNDFSLIRIPAEFDSDKINQTFKKYTIKYLRSKYDQQLIRELEIISQKIGIKYRSASAKPAQSKWGSCNTKNEIILNTYLAQLSAPLREYVMVHELAHTLEHNHSANFWKIVSSLISDYKTRKKLLKTHQTTPYFKIASSL